MKIGFIGTGIMGFQMAKRLIEANQDVFIYNRTKEKAKSLLEMGGKWCNSPSELADDCSVIFSMVTNDAALTTISSEVICTLPKNGIHVDCSTVSGALTSKLENDYTQTEHYFIHSPVLGSFPQAESGTLLLFVGGNKDAASKITPLLNVLGNKIWYFDRAEQASYTKLIMNSFIAGLAVTLVQGLSFASKVGIQGSMILDILSNSAMNAPMFQTKGKSIIDRNFTPRFFVENLLKDVNIMIDAAEMISSPVPVALVSRKILENAVAMGLAKEDYIALVKVVEKDAGTIIS
jgi:glyoxylate/succinic semialdehyde reductase